MRIHKAVLCTMGVCLLFVLAGCGTVKHSLAFNPGYQPQPGTLVEVGDVSNQTSETFDVDIEEMLDDALVKAFKRKGILSTGQGGPKLRINSQIVEYEKGSAFKRWLMPGWGATVVVVHCDLLSDNETVGSVDAKRTVAAGGGFTIGAWRTIFADLAEDIAKDLKKDI